MTTSIFRSSLLLFGGVMAAWCGDWNPRQAADYLDAREKAWFAWPTAKSAGGTCISCHTNMTYLMARPALRKVLGEAAPTEYETGLLNGIVERTTKEERMFGSPGFAREPLASQAAGVQSILAALLLSQRDGERTMSAVTRQAFDRMWAVQEHEGASKGAWAWFALDLDPWETPDAVYFGSALAAIAVGSTPASYRAEPAVKTHLNQLAAYLRSAQEGQPLHNRLLLLSVSAALPDALPKADSAKLVEELISKQQSDGGWTLDSLGPFKARPNASPATGSNAYATAVVTLALQQSLPASSPNLVKALRWLRSHQDPAGYWDATSMNKHYDAGSMQELFMRDAATAFASLALCNADLRTREMAVIR